MGMIKKIKVINKKIFLNSSSGEISLNYNNILNTGLIDIEEVFDDFKPTSMNICLCISNKCNMNFRYCFNEQKDGKLMSFDIAVNIKKQL